MTFFQAARSCLTKPEFWVLTGTALPPLNVLWAAGFTLIARLRGLPCAPSLSLSLNVQITYTGMLGGAILCGSTLTRWPVTQQLFAPGSQPALIAGITLGLLGALAVLSLVFFNTRAFTESLFGREHVAIPHLRFFRE